MVSVVHSLWTGLLTMYDPTYCTLFIQHQSSNWEDHTCAMAKHKYAQVCAMAKHRYLGGV